MRLNHARPSRPALWLAPALCMIALPLLMACGTSTPTPTHGDGVPIVMAIAERSTTLTREDLQVKQGDTVSLSFTADEAGEVHLHGYNLTAPVAPEQPGILNFEASTAGAFAINFHVFGEKPLHAEANRVVSETPVSIAITAEADADGGVDVRIATEGFRFAPEAVDQAHTPGAGHAHIYVDGVKLGRVFDSEYRIDQLPPGEHDIRVTLNTNDHSDLVFDGAKVEATTTVSVPDVGQGHGQSDAGSDGHAGHGQSDGGSKEHAGHDHDDGGEREIVAEVHLGNLEVYP